MRVPLEEGEAAGHRSGVGGGQGAAAVGVAGREADERAGLVGGRGGEVVGEGVGGRVGRRRGGRAVDGDHDGVGRLDPVVGGRDGEGACGAARGPEHGVQVAAVAGGDDGQHPELGQRVDGPGVRVVLADVVGAEREVDDVDVVGRVEVGVVARHLVQGRGRQRGRAGAAEDPQRDQRRAGSRAGPDGERRGLGRRQRRRVAAERRAVGRDAVAGDGAGDVGPVAAGAGLAVHRVGVGHRGVAAVVGVAGQVLAGHHLRGRERDVAGVAALRRHLARVVAGEVGLAGAPEVDVGVVDAGVDDGDGDARAGAAGGVPGLHGTGERVGAGVGPGLRREGDDARDARQPGQPGEPRAVRAHGQAGQDVGGLVEDLAVGVDLVAEGAQPALGGRGRVACGLARGGGSLAAGAGVGVGRRVPGQLDHDGDRPGRRRGGSARADRRGRRGGSGPLARLGEGGRGHRQQGERDGGSGRGGAAGHGRAGGAGHSGPSERGAGSSRYVGARPRLLQVSAVRPRRGVREGHARLARTGGCGG